MSITNTPDKILLNLSVGVSKKSLVAGSAVVAVGAGYALLKYLFDNRIVTGQNKELFYFSAEKNYGGELVAKVLSNHSVKFIFTLTGGHISPILVASQKEGIRVIDVRHEVTTVFAADAVSRLTGVPGIACVTAGPGLTNTITAVKNAQLAQSPLILLGGATSNLLKGRGSLQDIDQHALLAPHVKWMKQVKKVSEIVPALEQAFVICKQGTPGPVFIELPLDTLYDYPLAVKECKGQTPKPTSLINKVIGYYISMHLNRVFSSVLDKQIQLHEPAPIPLLKPSEKQLKEVLHLLIKAKRPVLVVGSQVMQLNNLVTVDQLQRAVQNLGIPTFTSSMCRGLLGPHHPNLFQHCRSYALSQCDLVILAGVACDFRLKYGFGISGKATIVSINVDLVDLYKNRRPTHAYNIEPSLFLTGLFNLYQVKKPTHLDATWKNWHEDLNSRDIERNQAISKQIELPPSRDGVINPLKALKIFDQSISSNSILVGDGGDFVASASYIVSPRGPLGWLDPGVFGTLGVGAGFALGAKLVHPDKEVWVIFGDGAFGMQSVMEFDTFVRHNVAVGAIIGNDACWTQIKREQVGHLHSEVACNLEYNNYDQVVKALGAEGFKATNEHELHSSLDQAKIILSENQKPVVINCIIDTTDFRKGSISV